MRKQRGLATSLYMRKQVYNIAIHTQTIRVMMCVFLCLCVCSEETDEEEEEEEWEDGAQSLLKDGRNRICELHLKFSDL